MISRQFLDPPKQLPYWFLHQDNKKVSLTSTALSLFQLQSSSVMYKLKSKRETLDPLITLCHNNQPSDAKIERQT